MKTGIIVMYNGIEYIVTKVEREFGKAVGLWCDNCAGDEAYLLPGDVEIV